jgi:hypothetical protein
MNDRCAFTAQSQVPRRSNKPNEPPDIKVFIRDTRGKYLAEDANGLFFSEDRSAALVFNYRGDGVAEQLENLAQAQGIALTAEPVPPEEIYETCDRCRELFMPFMTFFDGKQFLCPDCRRRLSHRPVRRSKSEEG